MKTQHRYNNDILVLSLLENTLDVENAAHFRMLMRGQLDENPAMVVDLGELRGLDSFGVEVLTQLAQIGVTFCGLRGSLKEQLDHVHACNFVPSTEAALSQNTLAKPDNAKAMVCSLLLECGLL